MRPGDSPSIRGENVPAAIIQPVLRDSPIGLDGVLESIAVESATVRVTVWVPILVAA